MELVSINPATEDVVNRYDGHDEDEVDQRLDRATEAFSTHARTAVDERAEKMRRAGDLLEERAQEWGEIMTREMGKPIAQARAEAQKCAWVCRYYADHAAEFLKPEIVETDASRSFVTYQPIGPILAVMPWNFPFWQVFRFAAPALMAGNVGLLKHASNVTGCALAIEEVLREAGFDSGEFQTLLVGSEAVADIIADDRIAGVTLTGSEGAGRSVGSAAGKALKPSVLELGGSDPFVVLADADLELAVDTGVTSRMQNSSQSCISAKRFILERSIADDFIEQYVRRMEALTVGNPIDEDTEVGPLARGDLREDVHDQVERSLEGGAELRTGGRPIDGKGFFYEPTVLAGVAPGNVAFEEEIFGPVASMAVAEDADHAIELANASPYGLGGTVFTEDLEKGEELALRLEVGCAFVNGMVKSDPRLPFGGVKISGYGRELSHHGLREFVNTKTVWIG